MYSKKILISYARVKIKVKEAPYLVPERSYKASSSRELMNVIWLGEGLVVDINLSINAQSKNIICVYVSDINECVSQTGTCHRGQVCINTAGSYICQRNSVNCGRGYHLNDDGTRCLGTAKKLTIPSI